MFHIWRGDGYNYEILPVPESGPERALLLLDAYPTREAALNGWIDGLIRERELLNAAIATAQKKQRRWDQRVERRG